MIIRETFGRQYTSEITGKKTATRVYFIICRDSSTPTYIELSDVVTEALSNGLPALGSSYGTGSFELSLIAVQHTPTEVDKELGLYNIEVKYETQQITFASPTDRDWQIQFSSIFEEYVPEQTLCNTGVVLPIGLTAAVDINKPIINSAGMLFDPPVTDVKTKVKISLTKNFTSIPSTSGGLEGLFNMVNCINDDAITIAGISGEKLQFLLEEISAQNVEQDGEDYYAVTYSIIYDPEYHFRKILNAGWQDANGNLITGLNGGPISAPWPLTALGMPIRDLADRITDSNYFGFGTKRAVSFSSLSLPTTF